MSIVSFQYPEPKYFLAQYPFFHRFSIFARWGVCVSSLDPFFHRLRATGLPVAVFCPHPNTSAVLVCSPYRVVSPSCPPFRTLNFLLTVDVLVDVQVNAKLRKTNDSLVQLANTLLSRAHCKLYALFFFLDSYFVSAYDAHPCPDHVFSWVRAIIPPFRFSGAFPFALFFHSFEPGRVEWCVRSVLDPVRSDGVEGGAFTPLFCTERARSARNQEECLQRHGYVCLVNTSVRFRRSARANSMPQHPRIP